MSKSRLIVLGALLCLAVFVSGCGGSGGSDTSTDTSSKASAKVLTKAAFIKRADQICERTDKVQKAALQGYFAKQPGAASQAVSEEAVVAVGLPPIRTEVEEIDALPVPAGDEGRIQAIVDGIEAAIGRGEKDPGSLVNSQSAGPFDAVGKLARAYGFQACAFPL